MLFPKYALEDLTIGSGSIIGKGNIEEFFNHVSMHKDVEDRSLAELAPSYEVAAAYLVHLHFILSSSSRFFTEDSLMEHAPINEFGKL
jgi:hypothetical protein